MHPIDLLRAKRQHIVRLANQKGAQGESTAISAFSHWIPRPKGTRLKTLLAELAQTGISIKGSSFDAIDHPEAQSIDFANAQQVRDALQRMTFIEIKTANQKRVKPGFDGFFFALTEAEMLASEMLKERHKVALYNNMTGELLLTSVPEILARSRSMNWQLSIQL